MRRVALWALLAAKLVGGWGLAWDIRWHLVVGRDSFWIPPHVLTYAGVALTAAIAFTVLLHDTWRARRGTLGAGTIRVVGLEGTPGFHLAWWGIALTILAAPIDDLWHRVFGLDVTLWSPPHLLGIVGAQINTLACFTIAVELWPRGARGRGAAERAAAILVTGAIALGLFYIVADQAMQTAYRHGGVLAFAWALVGGALFTFTLVLGSRALGWRSAPLLIAALTVGLHWVNLVVADAGFALLRPTPAVAELIAADPSSPIAIAHEIARLNGSTPGRVMLLRLLPLLPAALVALVDARCRPGAGAVVFGGALFAVTTLTLFRLPAFAHVLPSPPSAAAAFALTVGLSLAGAACAARSARPLGLDG